MLAWASTSGRLTNLRTAAAAGTIAGVACPGAEVRTLSAGGRHAAAIVLASVEQRAALAASLPGTPAGWDIWHEAPVPEGQDPFAVADDLIERVKLRLGAVTPIVCP